MSSGLVRHSYLSDGGSRDISALGIGQKEKEQFDSNVKLVRKKAEDYIKELDAANAEQKRKRELKKLSVNQV